MNCLKCKNDEKYFDTLKTLSISELKEEAKKNTFLSKDIELKYNILRSHIYLDFIEKIKTKLDKNNDVTKKDTKENIMDCVQWCQTFMDICYVLESYEETRKEEIEIDDENALECVESSCHQALVNFNSLVELCVIGKNYALYLYKKLFNLGGVWTNQYASYDGEYTFKDDDEVKHFEDEELIEKLEKPNDIVKETIDSLIWRINSIDKFFHISY